MHPFLDLHFIKIPLYGLSIATGLLIGSFIVFLFCKKYKKDFNNFLILAAVMIGFGFVGAKLLFLLVTYPLKEIPTLIINMLFRPKKVETVGGLVFYGGIILGIPGFFVANKIAQCKNSEFLPEISILLPFVHGFGRLGCFFAGCCYGIPYEGPFALHYTHPLSQVSTEIGIFPVQPLEALLNLTFSTILIIRYARNKPVKLIYYILYYSVVRFFLEYLRGDAERNGFWIFSTSQWISIAIIFGATIYLIISTCKKKEEKSEINDN